ncbi:MAG TPA: ATP-binding protein [Xanthobacteraceae bacterium]|nr:ATP-binding protein [Xanthobacteraceae bacterium]
MAVQDLSEEQRPSSVDRTFTTGRGGSIGLVLLVCLALIAAAGGFLLVGRDNSGPYVLVFLGVLAMVGVFALFALACGIMRVGNGSGHPVLKAMADEAVDGILITDRRGRVIYANAAYRTIVDTDGANDIDSISQVFDRIPEMSEAVYRLRKAASDGLRSQEEVRINGFKGGPGRWLRVRVQPLGKTGGDGGQAVWTVSDVTRDHERQENLFRELQHAIDYLDHAPAGFFSVDANGFIGYLNATLATWLDHDLAQVGSGGLRLTDIASGDGAALLTTLTGAPGETKTEVIDLDFKTRGGRSIPVRLFHKVEFGQDGTPGASHTLVLNRGRGQAADPQRAAEVRFMRFFQNTPMGIATVDKSGKILRSNALFARMFQGLLRDGGNDRSILSVVAEGERGALESAFRSAAEGKSDIAPVDALLAGVYERGKERYGRFYVTAVEDGERDGETAIVYAFETTEQRALQMQFVQAQKMETVGKLVAEIAHDLNNVLGTVIMATEFLLVAHKPIDPSFNDITLIRNASNRAAGLVNKLLAFSRQQTLRPEVMDLNEKLSELNLMLNKRLLGERIAVEPRLARDLWPVKFDPTQFEQVILNLAVNARDAMPNGGTLAVRTANVTAADGARFQYKGMPAADYVLIEVSDTGTGIPADIVDKVFDPFFTTKERGTGTSGTGLGLSTVYGIVKQSGGFIYLETEVGRGTIFRIFLPRYVPTAAEEAPIPADTAPLAATDYTGQGKILLVEDEEALRVLNARGLVSRGYDVLEAGNGVEALEVFNREGGKIDLVVSDVMMPEMDGPTLLKELRQRNPALKIVFVSGYAEDAFGKNKPEGQFDFLAKPFTLKQLVTKVKETMAS